MVVVYLVSALIFIIALAAGLLLGYLKGRSDGNRNLREGSEQFQAQLSETRSREMEARQREIKVEQKLAETADELKIALEERGKFGSDAARADELKSLISQREAQIETMNTRITALERDKAEALKDSQAANQRATDMIAKEREAQAAVLAAKDQQIAKLNEFIQQAREVLSTEFKALSSEALQTASNRLIQTADAIIEKHSEKTTIDVKLHQQQIQNLLQPVQETIQRLDKHVEEADQARSNAEALLDDQINRLAGASEKLTNALSKPVVRGSWGEMTLENALESAGLEPDIDYVLQHSTDAEDGRKRTDALVNLPKGRKLIIDSKNLMESYIALMSAEDDAKRAVLAEVHSRSLKAHIKSLSSKEYWRRYEGLDCVILFIPHDGMYHAAIRDESELIREACDKRVFIANPMSLIPLLKAVRYILDQDRLNKNAEQIKALGTDLYAELTRFAGNFATLGDRLHSTVVAYNDAIPGLDRYIVAKSRKLKQLGCARGPEAELPDEVDLEPKPFMSKELRAVHSIEPLALAAEAAEPIEAD
ncbi:MAG: DNA recombination protein RmuC [Terracidiphilus sp.]